MPPLKYTLPIFLFFSLCGYYFIIHEMKASGAPARFLEFHKSTNVTLDITDGLIPPLDDFIRPLISFFVSAFADPSSPSYPTVVAFVWSFSSAIQLPLVESLRAPPQNGPPESILNKLASLALSLPMLWGILYQRISGGCIIPIWLFFFLYSRARESGTSVPRVKAESALVGWWIGHTLPALVMLIPNQPKLCAIPFWVSFPILMSVFQRIYHFLRRDFPTLLGFTNSARESGYIPLMMTYSSAAVASFVAHVHMVLIPALRCASSYTPTPNVTADKDLGLMQALRAFFFAPFTGRALGFLPPAPAETTAASGVAHFVQCDVLIVFGVVWVALLWDLAMRRSPTESSKETMSWLVSMGLSLVLGSLILSPGAVTGILMMYREGKLSEIQRASFSQYQDK